MEPAPLVPTWDTIKMFSELRQILFLEFQKNFFFNFQIFLLESKNDISVKFIKKGGKILPPPLRNLGFLVFLKMN